MSDFKSFLNLAVRGDYFFQSKPATQKEIEIIRKYMGFNIPPSYLEFLLAVGFGSIKGWEFAGTVNKIEDLEFGRNEYSYPHRHISITDIGDDVVWIMNLDARDPKTGECPIVGWIPGLPADQQPEWLKTEEYFDTFEDFFRAKVGIKEEDLE